MRLRTRVNRFVFPRILLLFTACVIVMQNGRAYSGDLPKSFYFSGDRTQLLQGGVASSSLYDESICRTIELHFKQEDYWQQLEDNYETGTDIPADITIDNVTIPSVGVRFKGMSSYRLIGDSQKKSFNISIDFSDSDQELMGYESLNLNNCFSDSSLIREVLYNNICRNYIPCPQANFIHLIINNENWGIYANVQQIDSDFIKEWFFSNDGDRWKALVPSPTQGTIGEPPTLTWLGDDMGAYEQAYELKSAHTPDPWQHLISTCDILNNVSRMQLTSSLSKVLDIDRCLWFLAAENVFEDMDGYHSKGADYYLYYEPESGRIHPITYDGNETIGARTFRITVVEIIVTPFDGETDENRPLISRLLAVPELRQRYLAHMRTIIDESLNWDVLEPQAEAYYKLIYTQAKADTKKLTDDAGFKRGVESIQSFVSSRRRYLSNHIEINRQSPEILSAVCNVDREEGSSDTESSVQVIVQTGSAVDIGDVFLYYVKGYTGQFERVSMFDDGLHGDGKSGDGLFSGEIPPMPAGSLVRYYIEARSTNSAKTSSFLPAGAEHDVFVYEIPMSKADDSLIVINEIMASNQMTMQDPQGDYEDWIELKNNSDQEMDLSGMFLSDKQDTPLKWPFPDGTTIAPGGYLIVWADEDGDDESGLHANFKLSTDGETVILSDSEERGNAVLDFTRFGEQVPDISCGRYPDGNGEFQILPSPTPGNPNVPPVSVTDETPTVFILDHNFPNPFNSSTTISYTLKEYSDIDLSIYNLLGQNVVNLVQGEHQPGKYMIHWNGCDDNGNELSSGLYIFRLQSRRYTQSHTLLLLR